MDLARIDSTLTMLRERGDCQLRPSVHVGTGFVSNGPHRVGIAHLMLRPRFLLADPVGCGKTPQALVAFAMLKEKSPALRLLVVATKSSLYQWESAVAKFLVGLTVSVVGYDQKRRAGNAASRAVTYTEDTSDILITTYVSMARDIEVLLTSLDSFVVVFDEVQSLKSLRQRLLRPAALKVSLKARYCWGLSATPISNRLEELHAIMEVIRPGLFGSERRFQDAYIRRRWIAPPRSPGFWKVEGHQHLDQLMRVMRPYYLKRSASEIDAYLPPVVTRVVLLDMLPDQFAIYQQIVEQYFLPANPQRDGQPVTHLTSLNYAQQASDAPAVLGYVGVGSSKLEELLRFLREEVTDEKLIIYTRYERVVSYVCAALAEAGITSVRITGKEDAAAREAAKLRFNDTTSSTNVIVLNAAGGQALDLQAASLVLFFDLPWSWGEFHQVLGRARRMGSEHPKVLAILLANDNTIDTHTLATLNTKETLVANTINNPTTRNTRASRSTSTPTDDEIISSAFQAVRDLSHTYVCSTSLKDRKESNSAVTVTRPSRPVPSRPRSRTRTHQQGE